MQEITTREKLFALLGFFILLVSLPLALMVVKQRVTYRGRATGAAAVPIKVIISNVHAKGFTISWTTTTTTNGSVIYSASQNVSSSIEVQDVRGSNNDITGYYSYYIDVLGLNPETDYYFKIKSGPDTYAYSDANGWYKATDASAYGKKVRTAKQIGDETQPPSATNPYGAYSTEAGAFGPCPDGTLNTDGTPKMNSACFRPYPLWGEVKNSSGKAVIGAVVYAAISEDPLISPYVVSALADSNGRWSLDLANQYTSNFTNYLAYNHLVDKINIYANGYFDGETTRKNLAMVSVLSVDCPDPATNCPMNAPSPVILTLTGNSTPTATPTATNPPGSGISFTINKVQLQGRTDHTMSYVVKIREPNSTGTSPVIATANTTTNSSGVSSTINFPNLQAPGVYDIYLIPSQSYLSTKVANVPLPQDITLDIDIKGAQINPLCENNTKLCVGDIKGLQGSVDDEIGLFDYQAVLNNFGKTRAQLSDVLKQADFQNNGDVGLFDYQWSLNNFGKKGADRP